MLQKQAIGDCMTTLIKPSPTLGGMVIKSYLLVLLSNVLITQKKNWRCSMTNLAIKGILATQTLIRLELIKRTQWFSSFVVDDSTSLVIRADNTALFVDRETGKTITCNSWDEIQDRYGLNAGELLRGVA